MDKQPSQHSENENPKPIQFTSKAEPYFTKNILAQKQIIYDNVNQKYIDVVKGTQKSSDTQQIKINSGQLTLSGISEANNSSFVFEQFDSDGKLLSQEDITETVCCSKLDIHSDMSSNSSNQFINNRYENTQYQRHQVESKLQNTPNSWGFEDSMSILRFKSVQQQIVSNGTQTQSNSVIGVSNCGFEVTVLKQKKTKSQFVNTKDAKQNDQNTNEPQLVLTNLSLSQGVHVWEIVCPISCQDIWVGVYSPLSQQTIMETFYNTTPRSIFVCLDLNKGQINFWLNEHKIQNKILKLFHQPGQQWIPAIKICRERNKVILNPFPYLPVDFIEDFPINQFDQTKYFIPHLVNTICVTGLPELSTKSKKAVDQLKNYLHLSNNQLSKIILFKVEGNKPLPDNEMLCFLKFHNHELMNDFIEYHKSHQGQIISIKSQSSKLNKTEKPENDDINKVEPASQEQVVITDQSQIQDDKKDLPKFKIEILEPHEIISLLQMLNKTDSESVKKTEKLKIPLKLLIKEMNIPEECNVNDTLKSVENSYNFLKQIKNQIEINQERQAIVQQNAVFEDLKMIHQPFTDNSICIKNQQALKLIHRSPQTLGQIEINHQTRFNDPPRTLDCQISLKILYKVVPSFFKFMSWQSMIHETQTSPLLLGVIKKTFDDIISNSQYIHIESSQEKENTSYIQFLVNLVDIKYFLDLAISQIKLAIKRQSRILEGDSLIQELYKLQDKKEIKKNKLNLFEFQNKSHPSIEELYIVLNVLIDLDEQIWIQTRSNQCSADVKNFMNTISRPYSALNRLGSFIQFGVQKMQDFSQQQIDFKDSPQILAESGYFFKQSNQICLSNSGNSKAKIDCINFSQIQDNSYQIKHFGQNNRLLNNLLTDNVELYKSLNYQVAEISSQQIIDVIVSQNSQFVLVTKTNGVVHLHSSSLGLFDLKQIIMFKNEGKKANKNFMETVKKLQQKEKESLKFNQQILSKSAEIKLLQDLQNVQSKQGKADGDQKDQNSKQNNQKEQKKTEKKKQTQGTTLAKSGTILDLHSHFVNQKMNDLTQQKLQKLQKVKEDYKQKKGMNQQLIVQEDIEEAFYGLSAPYYYHDQKVFSNFQFSSSEIEKPIDTSKIQPEEQVKILDNISEDKNEKSLSVEDSEQIKINQQINNNITQNILNEEKKDEIIDENENQINEIKFEVSQCNIYGYFFLTEPAHKKAIDPIIVGCIFKYLPSNKIYIRVKKLAYKLNYITQFIELDPETGYYNDKISNLKIFKNNTKNSDQDIMDTLQSVIQQHQEKIIDLNAIFQRSLASKTQGQSKSKLDSRFQIFQDVCEQDIEITDCQNVIDFTKCSYSISQQNTIYILMEQKDNQNSVQTVLRQFKFNKGSFDQNDSDQKINYMIYPQEIYIKTDLLQLYKNSKEKLNSIKLFNCENNLILVSESQAFILKSDDGELIKKIEFGDNQCDVKTLNIVNKSSQSDLYWKYNTNAFSNQEWYIVYQPIQKISNDLCQINLFNQENDKKPQSDGKIDFIRDISQDELNTAILSLQDQKIQFTVAIDEKLSNQFLHSSSYDSNQCSVTVLDQFCSNINAQSSSLNFLLNPQRNQLQSIQLRKVQVSMQVKVSDLSLFQKSIMPVENNYNKSLEQSKQESIKEKSDKQTNIPLLVEQWKGAQTNDSHLPTIITTNNKSVFCSNYPEPEYIFRHFYDQQFIIKSFTIKSLFNRESWGMPIGKGYIFASDSLEDISDTRKFINKLKLFKKEWEPKEYYVPGEPIGMFDLDKDVEATFKIDQKYQIPFRYVKLVPIGFRKAPINFSRIKFHSKRAEIMYFGISGTSFSNSKNFSLLNDLNSNLQKTSAESGKYAQNQYKFVNKFKGICLNLGQQDYEEQQVDCQDNIILKNYLIDNTNASSQINKILKIQQDQIQENNNVIQPVFKIDLSFYIPQTINQKQNYILKLNQSSLKELGLQLSSLQIKMLGCRKQFENERIQQLHECMIDPINFFNQYFKPLVDSLSQNSDCKDNSILYNLKLVNELINSWLGEYKQIDKFIQFISIVNDQLLESILKSALQVHQIDQIQILNFMNMIYFNIDLNAAVSQQLEPIVEAGKQKIFKFVQENLSHLSLKRYRKSTIDFILKLQRLLGNQNVGSKDLFNQSIIQDLINLLNEEICSKQLLTNSDKFQIQRMLKKNYEIMTEDIFDGIPVNLYEEEQPNRNLKRYYRDDLILDFEKTGNNLLITDQLTEIYKVNNFYHFNIDFQGTVRANILKLVFNEKNTKKQLTFKIRVIVSVPDLSLCENNYLKDENTEVKEKLPLKVIYSQIFNENSVSQANQVAFKKSSQEFEQGSSLNKLVIDFQQNDLENGLGGILTRYMTIQIQLLETMKSQKDSSFMVNNFLIIPQVYGLKSQLSLPKLSQFEIIKPQPDSAPVAKTFIGLDKNPIYSFCEIQGLIKEFTNKKCALISIYDNSNQIQTKDQLEKVKNKIVGLRTQLKKKITENKDQREIQQQIDKILALKMKLSSNFAADENNISYDYFIQLRESICKQLLTLLKNRPELDFEECLKYQDLFKSAFQNLLKCMAIEETKQSSKLKSSTIKNGAKLIRYIFKKFLKQDQQFYFEIILNNLIGHQSDLLLKEEKVMISKFLQENAPNDFNQIIQSYITHFGCDFNIFDKEQNHIENAIMMLNGKNSDNEKLQKNINLKPRYFQIFLETIGMNKNNSELSNVQVNPLKLIQLLSYHLIYCKKIKFERLLGNLNISQDFEKSIKRTNSMLSVGMKVISESIETYLQKEKCIDFSSVINEITVLILASILINDQEYRQNALQNLIKIVRADQRGTVPQIIIEFLNQPRIKSQNENDSSYLKDVSDLIDVNSIFVINSLQQNQYHDQQNENFDQQTAFVKNIVQKSSDILQKVLNEFKNLVQQYQVDSNQQIFQWVKLFEISYKISQSAQILEESNIDFKNSDKRKESGLLIQFNQVFLDFESSSEQKKQFNEGIQQMIYPKIVAFIQGEILKSKSQPCQDIAQKKSQEEYRQRNIYQCLKVLDSILHFNKSTNNINEVQFGFAHSILNILQSDGEKLEETEVPTYKLEDLELNSNEKDKNRKSVISIKLNKQNTMLIMDIFKTYLVQMLNFTSFGGVAGASRSLIYKLALANQMASILDQAQSSNQFQELSTIQYQVSAFQYVIQESKESDKFVKNWIMQIITWIFSQRDPSSSKVQNQPSIVQAKKLRFQMLSILCKSCPAIEDICNELALATLNKYRIKGLNISLECLIQCIQSNEQNLREDLAKNRISQVQAFKIQENTNNLLMFLFRKWVADDLTAQNFLREHDGLNFMLNRLFQNKNDEQQSNISQDNLKEDEISSDDSEEIILSQPEKFANKEIEQKKQVEKVNVQNQKAKHEKQSPSSIFQEIISIQKKNLKQVNKHDNLFNKIKQKVCKNWLAGICKYGDKCLYVHQKKQEQSQELLDIKVQEISDLTQQVKEQELGNQMRIIYTSEKQEMAEATYKTLNLADYKSQENMKILVIPSQYLQQEFNLILEVQNNQIVQINEFCIGVYFKFSTYEKDMSYLPLVIVAQGGMKHSQGHLEDVKWNVSLTPKFDQGTFMNNVWCYAVDFSNQELKRSFDAKYIKLSLRYPMTALLEQSSFYSQLHKPMNYTIQFVSCVGSIIVNEQIQDALTDIQKESSLVMLSQFFQGKFLETFKTISSEPGIILKIKDAFKRIEILLETKSLLIKPIFISLCQENDELCDWVIGQQILNKNIDEIKQANVLFLAELINSQKSSASYLKKIKVIKDYLFQQMELIEQEKIVLQDVQQQKIMLKLCGILVRSAKNLKNKFQSEEIDNMISFSKDNFLTLIQFKVIQLKQFKKNDEIKILIKKALQKLLGLIFGDNQNSKKRFVNNEIDIVQASDILIQSEIKNILSQQKNQEIDWKKELTSFQNLDVLSLFSAYSQEVFQKIQNLEIQSGEKSDDQIINQNSSKYDLIRIIIEKLLNNQFQISDDNVNIDQNNEDKHILPSIIKQSLKNQVDPQQIVDIDKILVQNMNQENEDDKKILENKFLVQVLRNLSFNPKFQEFYGGEGSLSVDLYQKTLKNQSSLHKYSLMLNPYLDDESIQILLQIMIQSLLIPTRQSETKSIYLEQIGKLLKDDLNQASQKEDISFIKQIIVPLLHAEDKAPIQIYLNQDQGQLTNLKSFYENNQNQLKTSDTLKQNQNKQTQHPFFLQTDLLTDKMKENLAKKLVQQRKDKMPEIQQMLKCEWKKLYTHKKGDKDDVNAIYNNYYWNQSGFKELIETVEGKSNILILIKGKQGLNHHGIVNINNQNNNIVIGTFIASQFPPNMVQNWQHEFDYAIEYNTNNLSFIYSVEGKMCHYEQKMQDNRPFAYLYTDCEFGGAINIMSDYMMMSWSQDFSHTFGNQCYTQCLDEDSFIGPFEFNPVEIQVWHYQPGFKPLQQQKGNPIKRLKSIPTFLKDSPLNYFSENLIFYENTNNKLVKILNQYLPDEIQNNYNIINSQDLLNNNKQSTLRDFIIMQQEKQGNQIINFNLEMSENVNLNLELKDEQSNDEAPQFPILKNFEKEKGIYDLISVAIAVVKTYQSKSSKEIWVLWLNELQSFSGLPNFFNYFSKDFEKAQTIYKLISRAYDIDSLIGQAESDKLSKEYDKLCTEHVKYTYKTIDEIFKNHSDTALREYCIQNGIFSKFLHRLSCLTGEKERHKKVESQSGEIKSEDQIKIISVKPIYNSGKTNTQDNQKKKGVGYTTGVGSAWNVQEYLESKEVKNQQISTIINILKHSINDSFQVVRGEESSLISEQKEHVLKDIENKNCQFKDLLLESALLPILEQAMRSGSLLEMAKETELYNSYLGLIQEIAKNQDLNSILKDIGDNYLPEQNNSVQFLLDKVAQQSQIFLGCLESKEQNSDKKILSKEDEDSKKLAEKIMETNKILKENIKDENIIQVTQEIKIEEIDNLPLEEAYRQLLQPLRFDYISMKKNPSDKAHLHKYDEDAQAEQVPSQSKIIRLAQEIADLSNSLPCDPTNAMFCRVAKSRVDLMKVLIMGAAGTPYAHGAFFYDLFFPSNYPQAPPKTLLTTTGGGTVRFNPNLYNQGKVCLSLLGTWRGSSTEMWDPKLSTILQLVLSIQAIIMSNEVYFNEPGYEHEMNTVEGEKKNRGYQNIVKYCNVKFAIIENIKSPPKGFEKIIRRNYYLKKQMILDEVKQWCEEAKDSDTSAAYSGLVYDHNYLWAPQISKPGAYKTMMDEIYIELEKTLNSIPHPMDDIEDDDQIKEKSNNTKNQNQGIFKMDFEDLSKINVDYQQPDQQNNQENNDNNQMKIDITDEKVKDRWSRYIGAMGIEAVAKQAESRILICDVGSLGIEIAKNIILAGCKELVIFERPNDFYANNTIMSSGQFFLQEEDTQLSMALQSKHKLQQLNHYVKVTIIKDQNYPTVLDYLKDQKKNNQDPFRAVIHTENYYSYELQNRLDEVIQSSKFCRSENIPFIWAFVAGCSARIFNDFGQKFQVVESSSEEISDVIIHQIQKFEDKDSEKTLALITLMEGFKNQYQEGDMVCIQKVVASKNVQENSQNGQQQDQIDSSSKPDTQSTTLNVGSQFQVKKVINTQKFLVEMSEDQIKELSGEQECIAKYLKTPKIVEFRSLEEYLNIYSGYLKDSNNEGAERYTMDKIEEIQNKAGFFDENLIWADFEKLQEIRLTDFMITTKLDIENISESDSYGDHQDPFINILQTITDKESKKKFLNSLFKITIMYDESTSCLPAMSAFIGGVVSQEIIKAVTQKFMPIKQVAIFSCSELIEDSSLDLQEIEFSDNRMLLDQMMEELENRMFSSVTENQGYSERDISQIILLGETLHEKIKQCKLFMVGSGAIGCELLKNYAMLGLGSGKDGHIILTDPDVIEVSNLNRQFLFREQHLRKPKSSTAAAAAIQMNKELKGHIFARLDKIHDGTQDIYTEEFYENQTIITNALDNVQARLYLDKKCVQSRVPMIDSGTLGPKGHVQVVIPYKTESYASQKDPDVNSEIPHCTLKMFPEETLHCVEWAKDLFGNWFTLDPQSYNKFIFSQEDQDYQDTQVLQTAKKIVKIEKKRPHTFEDCIAKARKKFQRLFSNQILQLLHTYPIDKLNKDGRPFWSLPKRPPRKIDFDPSNKLHSSFIASCACLYAVMYKIDLKSNYNSQFLDNDMNPRSDLSKQKIAEQAAKVEVKPFVPNDLKSKEIEKDVEKQNKTQENSEIAADQNQSSLIEQQESNDDIKNVQEYIQSIKKSVMNQQKFEINPELIVEEFEKDNDSNFHIDFIYSMANIRASNYSLTPMDWITVKIKAGKIVPALATTTAAVAALQTIELLKVLKGLPINFHRNSFLNLAVPSLMMGEPGAPQKFKITEELSVSLWDRWEFNAKQNSTMIDVIKHLELKVHKGKLQFRDIFQGATPIFLYSFGQTLMKTQKLKSILDCEVLNKTLVDLLGLDIQNLPKFVDFTITFSVSNDKDDDTASAYEILKNVPDVRVYINKNLYPNIY